MSPIGLKVAMAARAAQELATKDELIANMLTQTLLEHDDPVSPGSTTASSPAPSADLVRKSGLKLEGSMPCAEAQWCLCYVLLGLGGRGGVLVWPRT